MLGRADATQLARAAELSNVRIVGRRWSGKSRVLDDVKKTLSARGVFSLLVRAIPGSGSYDALRLALPATESARSSWQTSALAYWVDRIASALSERPAVILVDDVHDLDLDSWTALKTACITHQLRIVGTEGYSRSSRSRLHFVRACVELELEPMDRAEVHRWMEQQLGGAVSVRATVGVSLMSGGLEGLVVALVEAARTSRVLRRRESQPWTLPGSLASPLIHRVYEAFLSAVPAEELETLEKIAFAYPLVEWEASALVGQARLEALEVAGLVSVVSFRGCPRVTLVPPGIVSHFRERPYSIRSARIARNSGEDLTVRGPSSTWNAKWLQTSPVSKTALASVLVNDMAQQLDTAWTKWRADPGAESGSRVLELSLSVESCPLAIDELIRTVTTSSSGGDLSEVLCFYIFRWMSTSGRHREVGRILREANQPESLVQALAVSASMEHDGITREHIALLKKIVASGKHAPISQLLLAMAQVVMCDSAEAIRTLESQEAYKGPLRSQLDAAHALAVYSSGQFEEAYQLAEEKMREASATGDRFDLAAYGYIAAVSHIALGSFKKAQSAAEAVVSTSSQCAALPFAPTRATPVILAALAALAEDRGAVDAFAVEARSLSNASRALPFTHEDHCHASIQTVSGEREQAASTYMNLAANLARQQFHLASQGAALLSLFIDRPLNLEKALKSSTTLIGGHVYAAYLDARTAVAANAPDQLVRAATRLFDYGARETAARYLSVASKMYRELGERDTAEKLKADVRDILNGDDLYHNDEISSSTGGISRLSAREQQIVAYVAEGYTNTQIAQKLCLSIRTVETHLRNIRRKTGAVERQHIAIFAGHGVPL